LYRFTVVVVIVVVNVAGAIFVVFLKASHVGCGESSLPWDALKYLLLEEYEYNVLNVYTILSNDRKS
jgi:hypothetical protein